MANWPARFEDIISEINGVVSPSEERRKILKEIYITSIWDSLKDLSISYRNNMISKENFDNCIDMLAEYNFNLDEDIKKVNFYEEF